MLMRSSSEKINAFEMQFFRAAGTEDLEGNLIGCFKISLNISKFYTFPQGRSPYKI